MSVLLPTTVGEAVAALSDPAVQVLAGGTDFMVEVNAGRRRPEHVLSVGRIAELRTWSHTPSEVRLGAAVTYTDLLQPALASHLPALAQAARTVGSPQIRNAGTIGGNLATASPAGDTLPVLSALDAVVEVAGVGWVRDIPIGAFITGAKRNALVPGDLIVAVRIPVLAGHQEFRKIGVRNAMVISVASVALALDFNTRTVRCALGSVGPGPIRASTAEAWLAAAIDWDNLPAGPAPAADPGSAGPAPASPGSAGPGSAAPRPDLAHFGRLVAGDSRPIDDHRGTAAYRRHAVAVLAERAATQALAAPRPPGGGGAGSASEAA
jgi:CO/xanthine dehydrogenase FAD-binding subunit